MDQLSALALLVAAAIGLIAILLIVRRQRLEEEADSVESPFATSTEGEKICPHCGMGNLWSDATCASCGGRLPG